MSEFDVSQQRVLQFNPRQHARIVGAPGSGKTRVLVESFAAISEREAWGDQEVLVLAPNRLAAAALRSLIEQRMRQPIGGTPVRTATSLAFAILSREAARSGEAPPRLLTGTVHDEMIGNVITGRLERSGESGVFAPEVVVSQAFRSELREFARIVDDFDLNAVELRARCEALRSAQAGGAYTAAPPVELLERWGESAAIVSASEHKLRNERPGELSASGLLRAARQAIVAGQVPVPKLILVDDAQDLGEGPLALLAACAALGSAVWVFGDNDMSTSAFQGERSSVLVSLMAELDRRSPLGSRTTSRHEQCAVLDRVHRHGPKLRGFVQSLTSRIGSAGGAPQRSAISALGPDSFTADGLAPHADSVQFSVVASTSEQLGVIAHRMRARRLGIGGGAPMSWSDMAVVCRSRGEAVRIARLLAGQQVPTGVAAGGIVLREHQVVRELIRLLQHVLGVEPLDAAGVLQLVGGVLGGLDPVAVRRLRGSLLIQERRDAQAEGRAPLSIDEIVFDGFKFPGASPVIDSAGGRAIRKLGRMAAAAAQVQNGGGTPRETLWALWERARLADTWQDEALTGRGAQADEANRSLDAVMGLFFALQRHEEQDSEQPIADLLADLLQSTVPEDTLAGRSERERVTVTTPQGLIGRQFAIVAIVGVQDGSWPNLKARGSLLGTSALERWLRGGEALPPSRRETIHDELRLLAHASARASEELLVVAVADEDQHPSPFFGLGVDHRVEALPSSRLTLRGVTAALRRRATSDPNDREAVHSLAVLAHEEVPGAHPDDWYGVAQPSSDAPLFAHSPETSRTNGGAEGDAVARIPVSPSQLEKAENCALDWVIGALGGGGGSVQASLGTLVHHALETSQSNDPDELLEIINAEWGKLPFDAEWEAERAKRTAAAMAHGVSDYLREFASSDRELLGTESSFSLAIGQAELRGTADRIESRRGPNGTEITVVDLKTGRTPVSGPAAQRHVQLQAYQLGVALGAFEVVPVPIDEGADANSEAPVQAPVTTAAKLLYVHPDAAKGKGYVERTQSALDDETRSALIERITAVADVMAAGEFTARIEHHCSDPHAQGNCRLHIIQAVSHA